ncbi:MAG: hypothetical protein QGG26_05330 [Candidatus Undinarchaeales archaeon]|jgi:hypothetical protein|nr:hypothetical protein [Candidatus Undinarchaeales archaeon]
MGLFDYFSTNRTSFDEVQRSVQEGIDGQSVSDEAVMDILNAASRYVKDAKRGEEAKNEVAQYLTGEHALKQLQYTGEKGFDYMNGWLTSSTDDIIRSVEGPELYGEFAKDGKGPLTLNRPTRGNWTSDKASNDTFLKYQTSRMEELGKQHSDAYSKAEVYHGCSLSPDEVFKNGIPAKGGDHYNIQDHQYDRNDKNEGSALRGGCLDARNPAKFAGEDSFVYLIAPVGGAVDVNTALGGRRLDVSQGKMVGSIMYGETEFAFGSMQPAYAIKGAFKVGPYFDAPDAHRLGEFIPNPGYTLGV